MALRTREITMPTKKEIVADWIIGQINSGELTPGDPIPTHAELRERFGYSITPVREALNELKLRGYVVGQPGVAVYVAAAPPRPPD
jgi:GntR family transcriptional regulator